MFLEACMQTLRQPRASGWMELSKQKLKTNPTVLTTANFDFEACSSAHETRIRKACVTFGHCLLHLPGGDSLLVLPGIRTSYRVHKASKGLQRENCHES